MRKGVFECCLHFRVYKHNEVVIKPINVSVETTDISNIKEIIKNLSDEIIDKFKGADHES